MASTQPTGYQPVPLPDWKELLQSLADRFEVLEKLDADRPQPAGPVIDAKSRIGLVQHYTADLEYCLRKANDAIHYYENLTQNYDRLVAVMEESRNHAYDVIGRLKNEIAVAKECRPLADGAAPRTEKEDPNE